MFSSRGAAHSFCFLWLSDCTPRGDVISFSSRLTKRSTVTAAIPTKKDELVGSLDTTLFAFGSEGPNNTLKVCCFGNDNHLCIRHGRVIHDADTIGEALTGSWVWRFFGAWCPRLAFRFSCWRIILLKGQLSSSEDQGSPWAPSHGHQIIENAPWCSLVFCTEMTQRKTHGLF